MNAFLVSEPFKILAEAIISHVRNLLPTCIIVSHMLFFVVFILHIFPFVFDFFFGRTIAYLFRPLSFQVLGREDRLAVILSAIATVDTVALLSLNFLYNFDVSLIVYSADMYKKLVLYGIISMISTYIMAISMLYAKFNEKMANYSEDAFKMAIWCGCIVNSLYSIIYTFYTTSLDFKMLFLAIRIPLDIACGCATVALFSWISFYLFICASSIFYCVLAFCVPQYPHLK